MDNPSADQKAETIAQLMKFYSVDTLEDLVLTQDRHIERLQKKLPVEPAPDPFRHRPAREG